MGRGGSFCNSHLHTPPSLPPSSSKERGPLLKPNDMKCLAPVHRRATCTKPVGGTAD